MKTYKEYYFESFNPKHFTFLSETQHLIEGFKTPLLADYIGKHFLDALNVMCDFSHSKYEDWKEGFCIEVFGASYDESYIKTLDSKLFDCVEKAFLSYDGDCQKVNLFLAENLIGMIHEDFEKWKMA